MNAVKPRDRTDLYVVLASLFSLDAHINPTSVKKIKDLLDLHRRKIPVNLNDRMRKYSTYVSPFAGKPLRWSLTQKGIEHLRELSGLDVSKKLDGHGFDYDIGIICALEKPEFAAVMKAVGGSSKWREVSAPGYAHVYRETTIVTASNKTLRIVGSTSSTMGLTSAAIATTQLIFRFKPKMVVMIGIAAGTRSGGKQFGDVLVADPSVDYNSGKVVEENGIREFQPDPYPISLNPRLRSVLLKYRGESEVFESIKKRWAGNAPAKCNQLHVGPLGAADQVIDDANRIIEIQKNWRKLIGVEMETYGVYRAAYEAPDPKPRVISFKAVCDFAAEKSDSWQEYAAFMAAEFAIVFLRNEWDSIRP